MNRLIDYQSIKMQNFQLKNQITDLRNGFNLNNDVLKILSQQVKNVHPKLHIFYQIISRLTGINNQIMITNIQILQEKNKLTTENRKLQNTIDNLSEKIQQLIKSRDCVNPKQIHMEMRNQNKQLRSQILALNQDCLRKKMQIQKLKGLITEIENEQLKKPIIPSVKHSQMLNVKQMSQFSNIPKKFETQGIVKETTIKKNLQRQNSHLKRLVQQLEYRLTLLSNIYEQEPVKSGRDYMQEQQQNTYKKVTQDQLNLLMFALNNTELEQDEQSEGIKLTVTKRCKLFMKDNQKKITRYKSCVF